MRSGSSRRTGTGTNSDTQTRMRGLAIGGCGWPTLNCSQRDDEEEYYGSDLRPRSLALEEKEGAKPQGEGLDASSLPSLSESGMRSPQCRICFQGPEKVKLDSEDVTVPSRYHRSNLLLMSASASERCLLVHGSAQQHVAFRWSHLSQVQWEATLSTSLQQGIIFNTK